MKKIITLVASVILVATAFAQPNGRAYGHDKDRDVVYNDSRYDRNDDRRDDRRNNRYYFSKRDRDMQISQINRTYDQRINAVNSKWFASNGKKQRMMRELENERRYEIRKVYERYNHRSNSADDNDRRRNW
ncbi:MAG: hypothetical protein V4725_12860 [Bacteroidota bacterium]|nr:hypothetical protein [Ferruginibacter sp.]